MLDNIPDWVKENVLVGLLTSEKLWQYVWLYTNNYVQFTALQLAPIPTSIVRIISELSGLGIWQRFLAQNILKRIENKHQ